MEIEYLKIMFKMVLTDKQTLIQTIFQPILTINNISISKADLQTLLAIHQLHSLTILI